MSKYIILGIIQGLTEFLPISSSGHLVIAGHLLRISQDQVAISVVLHLGTAFALVVFFFKDLLGLLKNSKLLMNLLIVTVITGVIGVLGKDFFESSFSSVATVCLALIATGVMLIFTSNFMTGQRKDIALKDAVILGLTQAIAIIPGVSRSGTTISTLLFRGIDREVSFRVAFLAAIPVIFGAALLEAKKIDFAVRQEALNLSLGFIASFLTGLLSLWILKWLLRKAKLHYFGYYCVFMGIVVLVLFK